MKPRQHKRKRMRGGISETARQGPRPSGATLRGKGNAKAGDAAKLASMSNRPGTSKASASSETETPRRRWLRYPATAVELGTVGVGGDTSPHFVCAEGRA